jgi:hypothetical protein
MLLKEKKIIFIYKLKRHFVLGCDLSEERTGIVKVVALLLIYHIENLHIPPGFL